MSIYGILYRGNTGCKREDNAFRADEWKNRKSRSPLGRGGENI